MKNALKNHPKKAFIGVLIILLIMLSIFAWRTLGVGSPISAYLVSYETQVSNNTLTFKGTLMNSGQAFSKAVFTEHDGTIDIVLYSVPVSWFKSSGNFNVSYTAKNPIQRVLFDQFITYDGEPIAMKTAALYKVKHAYIGDMSQNTRVAEALNLTSAFGPYKNELKTSSPPYSWSLFLEHSPESDPNFHKKMTAYSCALLAVIDNLDEVHWIYPSNSGEAIYKVTKEDARHLMGVSIKDYSKSAHDLQHLMNQLNLY